MNILPIGLSNTTNYSKSLNNHISTPKLQLNTLNCDTVSFTHKKDDVEKYLVKDVKKYIEEEYDDGYLGENRYDEDFADWLITPDYNDKDELTPIENAIFCGEISYLVETLDGLDCDEEALYSVYHHCLNVINDSLSVASKDEKVYLEGVLSLVLNRLPNNKVICKTRDKYGNNILANLVYTNNRPALKMLFEKLDNKTVARLMLQRNEYGEFPVGTYNKLSKKNKLHGNAIISFEDLPTNKKIEPMTLTALRRKATNLIEDDNISIKNRAKIYEVYKPSSDSHSALDMAYCEIMNVAMTEAYERQSNY